MTQIEPIRNFHEIYTQALGEKSSFKLGRFEVEAINGHLPHHLEEYLKNEIEQRQKGDEETQGSGGIS